MSNSQIRNTRIRDRRASCHAVMNLPSLAQYQSATADHQSRQQNKHYTIGAATAAAFTNLYRVKAGAKTHQAQGNFVRNRFCPNSHLD